MTVCPRCENSRRILSKSCRRWIRCTHCTRRRADRSGKHLRLLSKTSQELTGAEARKMARLIEQEVARALIEKPGIEGVPAHLASTDRILERWGDAPTGMPSDNPDVYRVSRLVPLDDRTQEAVNDCVKGSLPTVRRFVNAWYLYDDPIEAMASRRRMSRRQLGREWHRVLVVMRQKFLASPHSDLRHLVHFIP